jgi:hypothetical protein
MYLLQRMTEPLYETPALNSVREDIFFLQVSTSFLSEDFSAVNVVVIAYGSEDRQRCRNSVVLKCI